MSNVLLSREYLESVINEHVELFETTESTGDLAEDTAILLTQPESDRTTLPVQRHSNTDEFYTVRQNEHRARYQSQTLFLEQPIGNQSTLVIAPNMTPSEPQTGLFNINTIDATATRGRVNWYPRSPRFGFRESSGRDYSIHFSAVLDYRYSTPRERERIIEHAVSRTSIFRPETNNSLSAINKNEATLIKVGFSEDNLVSEEEKDIFQRYCCSISKRIMTDPVYDSRSPQYIFDKSEILRWLHINPTHPFTRASLTPASLTPDVVLKQKIDTFITDKIAAQQQSINQKTEAPRVSTTITSQPISVNKLIQDYDLTVEQIQNMSEIKQTILLGKPKALDDLVNNAHIPLADLLNLPETNLLNLLVSHTAVFILLTKTNVTLDTLLIIQPEQSRALFTTSGATVASILINFLHMTLENILTLDPAFRDKLLYSTQMARAFVFLIKEMGIQMEDFLKLDSTVAIKLLNKPVILPLLLKETSLDKLLTLSREQWNVLLTNRKSSEYKEILTSLRDDEHQNTRSVNNIV